GTALQRRRTELAQPSPARAAQRDDVGARDTSGRRRAHRRVQLVRGGLRERGRRRVLAQNRSRVRRDPRRGLAACVTASLDQLGSLRRSLAEGRPTLGYLIPTPSVQIVQALARTGVDWLMLDTEHAPVGIESVAAMVAATGGTPATPIVRVPAARPELVKPVLDCGALGVVFPQIATRQEAEATVQAVRYAPKGQRGYGPTYAALRWGLPNLEYLKAANDAVLNVVLIETQAGVDALDDILSISGLDGVAVARGDFSTNLGGAGGVW